MGNYRSLTIVLGFIALGFTASADNVCQDGNCVSDPSLTSDSSSSYNPYNFNNDYRGPASAHASAAGSPVQSMATNVIGAQAQDVAAVDATATGGSTTDCVSPYPSLPLTAVQQQICEAGKARLIADAKQKAAEKAQAQQPQQPQQPQSPQSPQGGSPQGGDKGGDDKGGDQCSQKLKEVLKKCGMQSEQAGENCNPNNQQQQQSNASFFGSMNNVPGQSSFQSQNQASAGCAVGAQGMSQFAGNCENGTQGIGGETAGFQSCSKECAAAAKQVMKTKECSKSEDGPKKEKAAKSAKKKQSGCEALQEIAQAAQKNAESLGQCSNQAGKGAGQGAGGLGDMMKALMAMKQKADEEKKRQEGEEIGSVDVCKDESVMAGVPQICVCAKQGLTESQCASRVPSSVAPVVGGLVSNPVDTGSTGTTGGNTGGPGTTLPDRVLPAGVTGP